MNIRFCFQPQEHPQLHIIKWVGHNYELLYARVVIYVIVDALGAENRILYSSLKI